MRAAEKGYGSIVQVLLDAGAEVCAENPGRETALSLAVQSGDRETIRLLFQAKRGINAQAWFEPISVD